jgi:hypothetical protein
MRKFREQKYVNSKGEPFYKIFGPDPKNGKREIYFETVKGPGNLLDRAKARVVELTTAAFTNDTEFGRRQSRTIAMLAQAYLDNEEKLYQRTRETGVWLGKKGKSRKMSTLRSRRDMLRRFVVPILGSATLIALELDDIQRMVDEAEKTGTSSQARLAGLTTGTMLRWGRRRGWVVKPLTMALLPDLILPEEGKREPADLESVRECFKVVFGPRKGKLWMKSYLYRRIALVLWVANGARRAEMTDLEWKDIDWSIGVAFAKTAETERVAGESLAA